MSKPKYRLILIDKTNTKRKTRAGVLFENDNGSLGLVLNPGITISDADQDKYYMTFWPIDEAWEAQWRHDHQESGSEGVPLVNGDDIPF